MQKVTGMFPSWDRTKTGTKKGFDKVWGWADKLGAPVNRLTNRIGSEAFWPTTLDKESDKAARILRSFCKDGFYAQEDRPTPNGPKKAPKVLQKIPAKVIENAVGLAIFTTMRTGLWVSGAGGSGILIARKEDGNWSPPSGILLHTAGLGFLVGVDIYDCVVVINNRKALEAFTKVRATLGAEISAVAGPVGVGGVLENDGKWKQVNKPVYTYLKSRGFYAGVQIDGTIVIERSDENEKFYGEKIGVTDILAGKTRRIPPETKMLLETVKAAEGRTDFDQQMMDELEGQPAPGDVDIDSPISSFGPMFGVPEADDPDPFGVLALEKEGFEIREAGTQSRPMSSQFDFKPQPTSPIYAHFHRLSIDTIATSHRGSLMSRDSLMSQDSGKSTKRNSIDRSTQTTEMGTQTDGPSEPTTPATSPNLGFEVHPIIKEEEEFSQEPEEIDYTKIDLGPYSSFSHPNHSQEFDGSGTTATEEEHDTDVSDVDSIDEQDDEPVIYEAATVPKAKPVYTKARGSLVTIPKRVPPTLPPRSPRRSARESFMIDAACGMSPVSPVSPTSLTAEGFEDVDLTGRDTSTDEKGSRANIEEQPEPAAENLTPVEEYRDLVASAASFRDEEEPEKFHSLPTTPAETVRQAIEPSTAMA